MTVLIMTKPRKLQYRDDLQKYLNINNAVESKKKHLDKENKGILQYLVIMMIQQPQALYQFY